MEIGRSHPLEIANAYERLIEAVVVVVSNRRRRLITFRKMRDLELAAGKTQAVLLDPASTFLVVHAQFVRRWVINIWPDDDDVRRRTSSSKIRFIVL